MGFLDLSTSVSSKKHVDFNDARYQLSDKLRQNNNKNVRSTFTLYDTKEHSKTAVQEITAAYALSDKHLPLGELLSKMVDLIIDMEDGVLNTEKDAIYAWKYSMAILQIFDDKIKRQETLNKFDNGLKASIINSNTFNKKYPGKYNNRTNFYDNEVRAGLITDVVETFKEVALPGIHTTAIKQSREIAEKHENQILDKIVQWAIENYNCTADSFFNVEKDENTNLFFSTNTIIIHLNNGYDMSIIGYVGTDYDDKFAISVFDANSIKLGAHGERASESAVHNMLDNASKKASVNPLTKLLTEENEKNKILKQQYDILFEIRPMVSAEALALQAAESVVGQDYIWGCKSYRETHDDLPKDFKIEDIQLPQYKGNVNSKQKHAQIEKDIDSIAKSMSVSEATSSDQLEEQVTDVLKNSINTNKDLNSFSNQPIHKNNQETTATTYMPSVQPQKKDIVHNDNTQMLFDENPSKKPQSHAFGADNEAEFKSTKLSVTQTNSSAEPSSKPNKQKEKFDMKSTLLPGVILSKKKEDNNKNVPSITGQAKPIITQEQTAPKWKDPEPQTKLPSLTNNIQEGNTVEQPNTPDLVVDNFDDLFA